MKCQHFYSLVLLGTMASSLWGCSPKEAETQPTPSPSTTIPAGVVEVSRLSGPNASSTVTSASKSGQAATSEESKADGDGSSKLQSVASTPQTDNMSGQTSDKAADSTSNNVKTSDTVANTAAKRDVQTLDTTAITARGENPWTLDAKKVQYDETSKRVRVSSIVWSLLDKQNEPRLTVYGKAADVNIESQNVAFDGPVEAEGSEGETMKVNHLVWDSAKQKILGTHGVRVVRRGTVMTGDNLVASPDLKQVEISGNVRVTFVDPEASTEI